MSEAGTNPLSPPGAPTRPWYKRVEPWVVLAVVSVALWLFYRELKKYDVDEVLKALRQTLETGLWKCVALTVVSYLVLIGYDMLALRAVGQWLPLRRVSLASFTGFAVSYNFGALLGGSTVRYRLYAAWGLSSGKIVRLFVMMGVTFWVGSMLLAGAVFLIYPLEIPEVLPKGVKIPFSTVRPLGALLLAVALGYVGFAAFLRGGITIRGRKFEFPSPGITMLQLLVAALDLIVAAGCLYVLIQHDTPLNFVEFLAVYLFAIVVVILSHVPGGVGVLEVLIINLCRTNNSQNLLAALLVFRLVYYVIPLILAGILLGVHELMLHRSEPAEKTLQPSGHGGEPRPS